MSYRFDSERQTDISLNRICTLEWQAAEDDHFDLCNKNQRLPILPNYNKSCE